MFGPLLLLAFVAKWPLQPAKAFDASLFNRTVAHLVAHKGGKADGPGSKKIKEGLVDCVGEHPENDPTQIGQCCGRYSQDDHCLELALECEQLFSSPDQGTAVEKVYRTACEAYCKELQSPPTWCSLTPADVAGFAQCEAGVTDSSGAGKCCGTYPKMPLCQLQATICEQYYKGTLSESSVDSKDADAFCGEYCSALAEKASWCPGLSAGAIAGIVVACVVVVGAGVGVAVFFILKKKKAAVGTT
jgi:hypothetical protein